MSKITIVTPDGEEKVIETEQFVVIFQGTDADSIEVNAVCKGTFIYEVYANDVLEQLAKSYLKQK